MTTETPTPTDKIPETQQAQLDKNELREKLRERVKQSTELNAEEKTTFEANLDMIASVLIDGDATEAEVVELKKILPDLLEQKMIEYVNEDLENFAKELIAKQAPAAEGKVEVPDAKKLEAFAKAGFYMKHQPVPKVTGADFVEALKKDLQNFGLKQKEEIDIIDFTSIQTQIDGAPPDQKQALMQQKMLELYGKHAEQIKEAQANRPEEKFKTLFDDFINKIQDNPMAAAFFADVLEGIRDLCQENGWDDYGTEAAVDKLRLGSYKKELEKTLENFSMTDEEIIEIARMCRKLPKDNPNRDKFGDYVAALKEAYMNKHDKQLPPGGKWEIAHLKEAAGILTTPAQTTEGGGANKPAETSNVQGKKPEEFWEFAKKLEVLDQKAPATFAEFEKNHGEILKSMDPEAQQFLKDNYAFLMGQSLLLKIQASKYFDIRFQDIKAVDAAKGSMTINGHGDQEYQLFWQKNPLGGNDNWSLTKAKEPASFASLDIGALRTAIKTKLLPPGPAETAKPAGEK